MVLDKDTHKIFTKRWRKAIKYGKGTREAQYDDIVEAAKKVYEDCPDILELLGLK